MSKLLAVDPGIRGCGVALFEDGLLTRAAYVKNMTSKGNGIEECHKMAHAIIFHMGGDICTIPKDALTTDCEILTLAVEFPQVYTHSKGDPNDLFALAGVGCALYTMLKFGMGGDLSLNQYLPRQWKGQMSKEVCHARIKDRLSPSEMGAIEPTPKSLIHNVYDAIGIGLFALGRLERKRADI